MSEQVLVTDHGVVVVRLVDAQAEPLTLLSLLPAEERALADAYGPRRVRTFAAGRLALRRALVEVGCPAAGPLLRTPRGAPRVAGARASVSHKDTIAVALAAAGGTGAQLGVDVEVLADLTDAHDERGARGATGGRDGIASYVLTARERAALATDGHDEAVLLRFSLKEALYKALDPFVQRFVGFTEVEAWPGADGSASFTLPDDGADLIAEGRWRRLDGGVLLTSVAVTRRPWP